MGRRRATPPPPPPPPLTLRDLHPAAREHALSLAGGDASRVVVQSRTSALVVNQPA